MLKKILKKGDIRLHLKGKDKDAVIEELLDILEENGLLKNRESARKAIHDREQIIPTALGHNIAFPHAKCKDIDELHVAFGIHPEGVDFNAPDNLPVHIFCLILSPVNASGPHIQCLAETSRLLHDSTNREKILSCKTAEELLGIIQNSDLEYSE